MNSTTSNSTPSNFTNSCKKAIFTLAHQLIKNGKFNHLSEALRAAWTQAKSDILEVIRFKKISGEETTRVISRNLSMYTSKSTGTGRKRPEGLLLFIDIAKVVAGSSHAIISAYADRIIKAA